MKEVSQGDGKNMKLLSGTFDKPNKILNIAIQFENNGWVTYSDRLKTGIDVDSMTELLIIVRKYKKTKNCRIYTTKVKYPCCDTSVKTGKKCPIHNA